MSEATHQRSILSKYIIVNSFHNVIGEGSGFEVNCFGFQRVLVRIKESDCNWKMVEVLLTSIIWGQK